MGDLKKEKGKRKKEKGKREKEKREKGKAEGEMFSLCSKVSLLRRRFLFWRNDKSEGAYFLGGS
jgi:hypothetical protein